MATPLFDLGQTVYDTVTAADAAAVAGDLQVGDVADVRGKTSAGDGNHFLGIVEATAKASNVGGSRIRALTPYKGPLQHAVTAHKFWRTAFSFGALPRSDGSYSIFFRRSYRHQQASSGALVVARTSDAAITLEDERILYSKVGFDSGVTIIGTVGGTDYIVGRDTNEAVTVANNYVLESTDAFVANYTRKTVSLGGGFPYAPHGIVLPYGGSGAICYGYNSGSIGAIYTTDGTTWQSQEVIAPIVGKQMVEPYTIVCGGHGNLMVIRNESAVRQPWLISTGSDLTWSAPRDVGFNGGKNPPFAYYDASQDRIYLYDFNRPFDPDPAYIHNTLLVTSADAGAIFAGGEFDGGWSEVAVMPDHATGYIAPFFGTDRWVCSAGESTPDGIIEWSTSRASGSAFVVLGEKPIAASLVDDKTVEVTRNSVFHVWSHKTSYTTTADFASTGPTDFGVQTADDHWCYADAAYRSNPITVERVTATGQIMQSVPGGPRYGMSIQASKTGGGQFIIATRRRNVALLCGRVATIQVIVRPGAYVPNLKVRARVSHDGTAWDEASPQTLDLDFGPAKNDGLYLLRGSSTFDIPSIDGDPITSGAIVQIELICEDDDIDFDLFSRAIVLGNDAPDLKPLEEPEAVALCRLERQYFDMPAFTILATGTVRGSTVAEIPLSLHLLSEPTVKNVEGAAADYQLESGAVFTATSLPTLSEPTEKSIQVQFVSTGMTANSAGNFRAVNANAGILLETGF